MVNRLLAQSGLLDRVMAETLQAYSDGQLLERFVELGDEAAFTALLDRHGPMLLARCRRWLGDAHLAEDVVQATFLVLARKGRSIRRRTSIAGWLYGVARRITRRAQLAEAARTRRDRLAARDQRMGAGDGATDELLRVLDEELHRLAERYRLPLLLCYLEGRTQDEAAQRLGWSLSTLRRRLEHGRELLRARMVRRGATLGAGLSALALASESARAALPAELRRAILGAAASGGRGAAISATVLALAGGFRMITWAQVLLCSALIIALGGLLIGATWQGGPDAPALAPPPEPQAKPAAVEAAQPQEVFDEPIQEALKRELMVSHDQQANPGTYPEAYWKSRQAQLLKRVRSLHRLADLKSAFLLEEWRPATRVFARSALTELAEHLLRGLNREADSEDAVRRLAAVDLMRELSERWESARKLDKISVAPLLPLLARLTRDREPLVAEAAVIAAASDLGEGRAILDVLQAVLKEDSLPIRAAAARALRDFIETQRMRQRRGRTAWGLELDMPSMRAALRGTVEVAGLGLRDRESEVRRGCWSGVAAAAQAAADFLLDPFSPRDLPGPAAAGLKGPWDEDLPALEKRRREEIAENQPFLEALMRLAPAWERDLQQDGPARQGALEALRDMAQWRQRWLRRLASFPTAANNHEDRLLPILRRAEGDLGRALKDAETPARYAAIDTVETLGPELALGPALQAVKDADPFVREGAARVLLRRAPHDGGTVVPALTSLLGDRSTDVRITALQGLERYGSQARDKAAMVCSLAEQGIRRQRVQALHALRAFGAEACRAAVPVLLAAAAPAEDTELRVAAVAALSAAYPATAEVRTFLLRALRDPETAVRQAAAAALAKVPSRSSP